MHLLVLAFLKYFGFKYEYNMYIVFQILEVTRTAEDECYTEAVSDS